MLPDEAQIAPAEPVAPPPLPPAGEPFWGYTDLALFSGLLFASIAVIVVAVAFLLAFHPEWRTDQTPLLLPTQFALYALIYLSFRILFQVRYGKPVLKSLGWRASRFHLAVAAIGGVLLAFAVSGLASLLHTPKIDSPIEKLTNSPVSLAIFGVMAVTVAPLFEELLFRGFIQPLLSRTFGVVLGVVFTALLFGALHAPEYLWAWQYVAAVSLVGMVLGWSRARANSIIPSTVMHGSYNAIFVIALAITKHM